MDPITAFGIVSGGVQTLDIITKTVHGLWMLQNKFADADHTIHSLKTLLTTIKCSISQLRELARRQPSGSPHHVDYLEGLNVAVEGCKTIAEVLAEEVTKLTGSVSSNDNTRLGLRARVKTIWNEALMKDYEARLQAQVSALHLLLQVGQWFVFSAALS